MSDPEELATNAFITYFKQMGHIPKNATQLVNFCKSQNIPGVKYSIARRVVSNPPDINNLNEDNNDSENDQNNQNTDVVPDNNQPNVNNDNEIKDIANDMDAVNISQNNDDDAKQDDNNTPQRPLQPPQPPQSQPVVSQPTPSPSPPPPPEPIVPLQPPTPPPPISQPVQAVKTVEKASKPVSNPYLDTSLTKKFVTSVDNKKYLDKHGAAPKKSKVASAYDSFKEKNGKKPHNTIQLLSFCEKNDFNVTYSECAQYMQYIKKMDDDSSSDDDAAGYAKYAFK